jgi:hypothetical protein
VHELTTRPGRTPAGHAACPDELIFNVNYLRAACPPAASGSAAGLRPARGRSHGGGYIAESAREKYTVR